MIPSIQQGTYYIGVYGFRAAYYTITGTKNDPGVFQDIEEGIGTTDMLMMGSSKDYVMFMNDERPWTLSILPLAGYTSAYLKVCAFQFLCWPFLAMGVLSL
jgi:hypothetical protein